uniref:Large ribosomal subunit protein uL15m n=1 Tax=Aceria tosichella TaxID=561515 RepID=A0A6G1SL44_9ACAR
MDSARASLKLLKSLPRFTEQNLTRNPYKPKIQFMRGQRRSRWPPKSNEERSRWHPIGYEQGRCPWYLRVPAERYYENFDARRQYPPLNLQQLQMMCDMNLIDTNKPVDLATLCNTNHYQIQVTDNHYGVHLTSGGIDNFYACLNIEVQYAKEPVIAAIERNGGRITTAYFDIKSVSCLADPYKFFKKGEPIPKRMLPPPNAIDYYTDPKNRGYLADPAEVEKERQILAQKYGYEIPFIDNDCLKMRKHKHQVFFGLEPGYVINLVDREILEPLDEDLREYYNLC